MLAVALVALTLQGSTWTSVRITVWPKGPDGPARVSRLTCRPAGGTFPRPDVACRRLAPLQNPLAPVPPRAVCTDIYGGDAVARVAGIFRRRTVDAHFNLRNGCEIDRWQRVAFLFRLKP